MWRARSGTRPSTPRAAAASAATTAASRPTPRVPTSRCGAVEEIEAGAVSRLASLVGGDLTDDHGPDRLPGRRRRRRPRPRGRERHRQVPRGRHRQPAQRVQSRGRGRVRRRDARRRPPVRARSSARSPAERSSPRWPRAGSCRASSSGRRVFTGRPRRSWTRRPRVPKVGVVGSLVWDLIHGRDPLAPPTEEWGGIAYALGGLDASLPPEWEIVPLIKVGRDLAPQAAELLGGLSRLTPGRALRRGAGAEQPGGAALPVGRAALRADVGRRASLDLARARPHGPRPRRALCEFHLRLRARARHGAGAPPGFPWADLRRPAQPVPRHAARRHPRAPAARRRRRPGSAVSTWSSSTRTRCGSSPPIRSPSAAQALGAGVSMLVVTLGPKGAAYVAAPGFDGWPSAVGRSGAPSLHRPADRPTGRPPRSQRARTRALVEALDPTGCGDVFGAAACARLLAGDGAEAALAHATAMAARNAMLRGAGGLSRHLRGELLVP